MGTANTIDGALEPSETRTAELSDGTSQRVLPSVGGRKGSKMPVLHRVDLSIGSNSTTNRRAGTKSYSKKHGQKDLKRRSPSGNQRGADGLIGIVIGEHEAESPTNGARKQNSKRRNVSNLQNGVQPLLSNVDQQRNQQEAPESETLRKKKVVAKDQRREVVPEVKQEVKESPANK